MKIYVGLKETLNLQYSKAKKNLTRKHILNMTRFMGHLRTKKTRKNTLMRWPWSCLWRRIAFKEFSLANRNE